AEHLLLGVPQAVRLVDEQDIVVAEAGELVAQGQLVIVAHGLHDVGAQLDGQGPREQSLAYSGRAVEEGVRERLVAALDAVELATQQSNERFVTDEVMKSWRWPRHLNHPQSESCRDMGWNLNSSGNHRHIGIPIARSPRQDAFPGLRVRIAGASCS